MDARRVPAPFAPSRSNPDTGEPSFSARLSASCEPITPRPMTPTSEVAAR